MTVISCHKAIEWPATPEGCPEPSENLRTYQAEAWLIASHPEPSWSMLRRRDELINLATDASNRNLEGIKSMMPLAKFYADADALAMAIYCQAQRWHWITLRQVLYGARGAMAHAWTWNPDAERNLDGF